MKKLKKIFNPEIKNNSNSPIIDETQRKGCYIMRKSKVHAMTENGNIFSVSYEAPAESMITLKTAVTTNCKPNETYSSKKQLTKNTCKLFGYQQFNDEEQNKTKQNFQGETALQRLKKTNLDYQTKATQFLNARKINRNKTLNVNESKLLQQTYKQDIPYQSHYKLKSKNNYKYKKRSQTNVKTPILLGIANKNQVYLDRRAIQNQVYHNQPLQLKYGNNFFQYIVRDRYKDDNISPNAFIYQIRNKISETKFINKIYEQKPKLKKRQKMILKGIQPQHKLVKIDKNKLNQEKTQIRL